MPVTPEGDIHMLWTMPSDSLHGISQRLHLCIASLSTEPFRVLACFESVAATMQPRYWFVSNGLGLYSPLAALPRATQGLHQ